MAEYFGLAQISARMGDVHHTMLYRLHDELGFPMIPRGVTKKRQLGSKDQPETL